MAENPYSAPAATTEQQADGRARLVPPAIALLVVSLLWVFMALFGVVYFLSLINAPDADAQTRHVFTTSLGYMVINILYNLMLASGALSMVRRGSYVWAVTCGVLALVPLLGPFYCLGIPIGVWTLIVLRRPEVRSAFKSN
ncbi:MAG: hypothetical protein RIC55_09000 [Pirellulaceae bacterium]